MLPQVSDSRGLGVTDINPELCPHNVHCRYSRPVGDSTRSLTVYLEVGLQAIVDVVKLYFTLLNFNLCPQS